MIEHSGPISGVASYKDQWVATAGYDNRVILWHGETSEAIAAGMHDHLANQCCFSPCGKFLASSGSDATVRIWQVPSMKLLTVLSCHDDDVEGVEFDPTGEFIATASRDHMARIFSRDGKLIHLLTGHTADVLSVGWKGDGSRLFTSGDDGTIREWSTADGREISCHSMVDVETDTIVILDDGRIVAGDDDGVLTLISKDKRWQIVGHQAGIKRLMFDSSTGRLISLSYDRSACLWNLSRQGELIELGRFQLPPEVWPRSVAFLEEDLLIFTTFCSTFATYHLMNDRWDISRCKPTGGVNGISATSTGFLTIGDAGVVRSHCFESAATEIDSETIAKLGSLGNFVQPVGDRFVTGGQMGQLFDVFSGELIYQHHSPCNCAVKLKPLNGKPQIGVGTYTGELVVISLGSDGFALERIVQLHDNAVKGVATDGENVFSVCATGAVALHCQSTWSHLATIEHAHSKIANGCVNYGQNHYASVSRDLKLRLWRGATLQATLDTPLMHSIKCLAVDHNKHYLALGSYGGQIATFDLQNFQWIAVERPTTQGISCLTVGGDNVFLAGCYNGMVYRMTKHLGDHQGVVFKEVCVPQADFLPIPNREDNRAATRC